MRVAFAAVLVAGCGSSSVDMSLLLPTDQADYDLTCVTAVDVVALGATDKMPIEFSSGPCIAISSSVDKFSKLANAMANKIDVPLPPAGLAAVALRGRRGTCDENPAQYEAVFYGGASYKKGDTELKVPLARSISCNAAMQFTVKPVKMIDLFTSAPPHACVDYVDASSTLFSGDIRPTLVPTQPVVLERGSSSAPMSAATAMVDSYNAAYKGTCAALGLDNSTLTGLSCINGGGATACGAGALELALVPKAYADAALDAEMTKKYSGATIVGVWTSVGTVGPLSDATITLDNGDDGKVVYGSLESGAFISGVGTATDSTGGAIVYANGVVGITVSTGSKMRHFQVGAAPGTPGALIAVLN